MAVPAASAALVERTVAPDRLAAIRAPFQAFGGEWVDAPVLQPLTLLLDLAGEGMRARLFVVQGEGGAAEVCLRPDFTIAVASAHIEAGAGAGSYLYEGKAFRTAPRHSDRAVEFLQIGAEVYGEARDPSRQDAEVTALAWTASAAGGRQDLGLVMGDVSLFGAFLAALDLPQAARNRLTRTFASGRGLKGQLARADASMSTPRGGRLANLLAELPEAEGAAVLGELWSLSGIQPTGGRAPAEIVHRLAARAEQARAPHLSPGETDLIARYLDIIDTPLRALDRIEGVAQAARVPFDLQLRPWVERLKGLDAAGVPAYAMTFSTGFVRPFGYYDGMLFEVRSLELGYERPVAAGGRYDGLPARLGAAAGGGAVGCMVRPGRAVAEGRP